MSLRLAPRSVGARALLVGAWIAALSMRASEGRACAMASECAEDEPVCDPLTHACRACDPAHSSSDCADPSRPVCQSAGPDTGRCVASPPVLTSPLEGSHTRNLQPPFGGTGAPGGMIVVSVDGVVVGHATVDASGNWSLVPNDAVAPGPHFAEAANVQSDGSAGPPGNRVDFLIALCLIDSDCGLMAYCNTIMGVCVAVPQDDAETPDAGPDAEASVDAAVPDGATREAGPDVAPFEAGMDAGPDAGGVAGAGSCACSAAGTPLQRSAEARGWALSLGALALRSVRRRKKAQAGAGHASSAP